MAVLKMAVQCSGRKMPYQKPPQGQQAQACVVCGAPANVSASLGVGHTINCSRCGDFAISQEAGDDYLPIADPKMRALVSYLIRRLQGTKRPVLTSDFFKSLSDHSLPTPAEMSDRLLLLIDQRVDGRPGTSISIDNNNDLSIYSSIGAVTGEDVLWAVRNLVEQGLLDGKWLNHF